MNPDLTLLPQVHLAMMKYTLDGQDIDDVDADQVAEMVRGVYSTEAAAKAYVKKMNAHHKGQEDVHFHVRMHFIQN